MNASYGSFIAAEEGKKVKGNKKVKYTKVFNTLTIGGSSQETATTMPVSTPILSKEKSEKSLAKVAPLRLPSPQPSGLSERRRR